MSDDGQSYLYVLAFLKQATLKVSLTYDIQKIESSIIEYQNRLLKTIRFFEYHMERLVNQVLHNKTIIFY